MKILVVGSKGFIGNACATYFGAKGKVVGCDIAEDGGSNYIRIRNASDFPAVIHAGQYDVCINASGSAHVGFSFENPDRDYELNVGNVEHLLNAILDYSSHTRFINFSSAAVYGNPSSLPISESAATQPLSPYGKHKLESEEVLKRFHEEHGLKTVSLRVFSAYGPGLHKQLFWDIFQKAKAGSTVRLFGTGRESRDFIYITDLLRAVSCVMNVAEFHGEVINVASGTETTIAEAAKLFLAKLGQYELEFSGEEKAGDPKNWRAAITRLQALGFTPEVSVEKGLALTAEAYLAVAR